MADDRVKSETENADDAYDTDENETTRSNEMINSMPHDHLSMEDETYPPANKINQGENGVTIQTDESKYKISDLNTQSKKEELSLTDSSETVEGATEANEASASKSPELDVNIYDDTKPKRLKNSKTTKQDDTDPGVNHLLHGINVLISPDDHPQRSQTRRKGVSAASFHIGDMDQSSFMPYNEQSESTDGDYTKKSIRSGRETEQNGFEHAGYHESGDQNDRIDSESSKEEQYRAEAVAFSPIGAEGGHPSDSFDESEVQNIICPSESKQKPPNGIAHTETNICQTEPNVDEDVNDQFDPEENFSEDHLQKGDRLTEQSHSWPKRRSKSSADLSRSTSETSKPVPRKISAEANLESERQYDSDKEISDTQFQRKRRVSFGMVAYVKKGDSEHLISPLNDAESSFTYSQIVKPRKISDEMVKGSGKSTRERIPIIYVTEDEENEIDDNTNSPIDMIVSNGGLPVRGQEYDNSAYEADSVISEDSHETNEQDGVTSDRQEYSDDKPRTKKISTQSLPVGIGVCEQKQLSLQSDDGFMPKGILKNRAVSSESLASSTGSANDKRFKVRKDSIALFTDKHGQVGLLELRKESMSWKERLSIKRIWSKRREFLKKKRNHIFVFAVFSSILAFVIVGLHLHSIHKENLSVARKVFLDAKTRELHLYDADGNDLVSGTLGLGIPKWLLPTHCHEDYEKIHDKTCLIWKKFGTLNISFMENAVRCYNISWKMDPGVNPEDCFDVGNNFWYGPSNSTGNNWPIGWKSFTFDTSSVRHFDSGTFEFATEYYWLAANGAAIYIDPRFPLRVNWNHGSNGKLCLSVIKSGEFYAADTSKSLAMNYVLCNSENILKTHDFIRERFIPNLLEIPDFKLMLSPHWSTNSPGQKTKMDERTVTDLTKQLKLHDFNCSTIELDGQWEDKIGDFSFSTERFPNMTKISEAAEIAGCDYSLSLFPYFDLNSRNFREGLSRMLFVKSIGEQVPALIKWQHGVAAMLDVSNSSARDWFTNKVRKLKSSYGINTFRFAYGNSFWLPHKPVFSQEQVSPNKVKNMFSDLLSSFGDIVIESTSRSQHISSFIGIPSTIVTNKELKCLNNIIAEVLNLGHLGYPLVMADGFEMGPYEKTGAKYFKRPSEDLFIRWMQLSVFFPAMRYTVKPWEYDNEVIDIAKHLSKFHRETVLPEIKKLKPDILKGKPVIRPLWWRNPKDRNTFQISDQFLLGDKYLVAPILCEGVNGVAKRDIYIPKGIWRDIISNTIIPGPKWIHGYEVEQNEIPYFKEEKLHISIQ